MIAVKFSPVVQNTYLIHTGDYLTFAPAWRLMARRLPVSLAKPAFAVLSTTDDDTKMVRFGT
jgi:hypothetical protein